MIYPDLSDLFSKDLSQNALRKAVVPAVRREQLVAVVCAVYFFAFGPLLCFNRKSILLITSAIVCLVFLILLSVFMLKKSRALIRKFYEKIYGAEKLDGLYGEKLLRRVEYFKLKETLGNDKSYNLTYIRNLIANSKERATEAKVDFKLRAQLVISFALLIIGSFVTHLYLPSSNFRFVAQLTFLLFLILTSLFLLYSFIWSEVIYFANMKYRKHKLLGELLSDLETEIILNSSITT